MARNGTRRRKPVNLALQGGGAHGAFTWGVLDRLLQEPEIEIAAISGTSAGALNGAALKAGMVTGGPEAARENLDWLWAQMGALDDAPFSDWFAAIGLSPVVVSRAIEYAPGYMVADAIGRMTSPYASGPVYDNPLRRVAERFHYDEVCDTSGPALFVCATNVRTGKIRVFSGDEINTDVLLASTCLPTLFRAVEFEDPRTATVEAYWDGGYTGNPALFPLFEPAFPDDIVIVNINPLERREVPRTAPEIQNRINEISFNSSLLRELRAIAFVKRLLADGHLAQGAMKDVKVHMIADDGLMNSLSVATKLVPTPYVMHRLKAAGAAAAEAFLDAHLGEVGQGCSVDLVGMFS